MINFRMNTYNKQKNCNSCNNTPEFQKSYTPLMKKSSIPLEKNKPIMSYNEIFKQLNDKIQIEYSTNINTNTNNNKCQNC